MVLDGEGKTLLVVASGTLAIETDVVTGALVVGIGTGCMSIDMIGLLNAFVTAVSKRLFL